MVQYYNDRPITAPNAAAVNPAPGEARTLSEFDKHRETLLSDDAEDGWASELRRYLATMQRDVKKDTDIVEWWQVRNLNKNARYLFVQSFIEPCSAVPDTCTHRPRCPSISSIICSL